MVRDEGDALSFWQGRHLELCYSCFYNNDQEKTYLAESQPKKLPPSPEDAVSSEDFESSPPALPPPLPSSRQLARHDESGILGVSTQGRQALVLAEKKAQRSEVLARRAREWVYAKGANSQRYDQVDGKMKAGKQNHKLWPR